MKSYGIFSLVLLTVFHSVGCAEEYPVEECSEGQGLDLETEGIPFLGGEAGPVEVTLFVDFQCPPSAYMALYILAFIDSLRPQGEDDYITLYIRHLPSAYHSRSGAAALAAAAAHRQGDDAFRRLFPHLFKFDSADLIDEKILLYAELAELDLELFSSDLESDAVREVVNRDLELAAEIGFTATPGVVICGVVTNDTPDAVVNNLEYLVKGEI